MSARRKYLRFVYASHGLTPLQQVVFDAFKDGEMHDRVTIVSHLDGNRSNISKYTKLRAVADDALQQLHELGLIDLDSAGWYRRKASEDAPQRTQRDIDDN